MQRSAWSFATVMAACTLALGACSERADVAPNAPGSPGSTNSAEVVRPAMPDGPPPEGGSNTKTGSTR